MPILQDVSENVRESEVARNRQAFPVLRIGAQVPNPWGPTAGQTSTDSVAPVGGMDLSFFQAPSALP